MAPLDLILRDRFGHLAFRPGQREVVEHVVSTSDALVVMPTGAGKSLCYQLPALARGGVALVVSPLIALMKDQVEGLLKRGVRATLINSTISVDERRTRLAEVLAGQWELVFVAPERLTPSFVARLRQADIRLFAVDEAHCLSQWGHDFRPDYLRLGAARAELSAGREPLRTVALTATATAAVRQDVVERLGIAGCRIFIRGFDRPNLDLSVRQVRSGREKDEVLPKLCVNGATLVYCATRRNVERASTALSRAGIANAAYHGGLELDERDRVQNQFMGGETPVVVATNAFGMGVDKSDVRTIVHYDLPGTLEAYYQEIGRAGRDNRPSQVVLLFRESDQRTQQFFIDTAHPPAEWVHRVYAHLTQVGRNPVFATIESLAAALPDEAGERAAAACLYMLQREGYLRRIAPSDRPGVLRFVGSYREETSRGLPGLRAQVWRYARERAAEEHDTTTLDLWPDRIAEDLDLSREQVTAALRGLEDRGAIQWTAPERAGGMELLRPGEPLKLDEAAIRARRERELTKLKKMVDYAWADCRRRYILDYFGDLAPYERCGACDACRAGTGHPTRARGLAPDEILIVRKILSNVARMGDGYSPTMIARVLTGSRDEMLQKLGFHRLSTYALLSSFTRVEVEAILGDLVRADALSREMTTRDVSGRERSYATLALTSLGREVMKNNAPDFQMSWPINAPPEAPRTATRPQLGGEAADLLSALRSTRSRLARAADVPPYVVAPDRTLEDIARSRPLTRQAMLSVHGMAERRFAAFGEPLLQTVRTWCGR